MPAFLKRYLNLPEKKGKTSDFLKVYLNQPSVKERQHQILQNYIQINKV